MITKAKLTLLVAILTGIAALIFLWKSDAPSSSSLPDSPPRNESSDKSIPDPIGDQFLVGYGDRNSTPREDLEKIGRSVESMLLLFKNLDTRHIATNSQLSDFLRGENPEKTPHISPESPIFGPTGEITDRWGTPIFVHPIGTGLIELRSAGPDRILFNKDDLVHGF